MSKSEWKKSTGIAGAGALLTFLFIVSQMAWAGQDQQSKDTTDPRQKATVQQMGEKQSSAATTAKPETAETQGGNSDKDVAEQKSSGEGLVQGIKVHGHWTIEVRNPDGTTVKHIEFENSLDAGFSITVNSTTTQVPGGAAYLSALLSGQVNKGNLRIVLFGPGGPSNAMSPTNSPCPQYQAPNVCTINTLAGCGGSAPSSVVPGFSCDLSVTPLGTVPAFAGIQLSGSVQAGVTGQVSTVATGFSGTCVPQSTPPCPFNSSAGSGLFDASFTSSTNFPGAPISVSAGQTIAVTVNLSFS